MNTKVIFKIDEKLDFQNHLIGAKRISKNPKNISPEVVKYFKNLKNANEEELIVV